MEGKGFEKLPELPRSTQVARAGVGPGFICKTLISNLFLDGLSHVGLMVPGRDKVHLRRITCFSLNSS